VILPTSRRINTRQLCQCGSASTDEHKHNHGPVYQCHRPALRDCKSKCRCYASPAIGDDPSRRDRFQCAHDTRIFVLDGKAFELAVGRVYVVDFAMGVGYLWRCVSVEVFDDGVYLRCSK
jgi:hypothetical protein